MPMSINGTPKRAADATLAPAAPGPIMLMPGEGTSLSGLGVTLNFKTTGAESDGQWLVLEYSAPPGFAGPPVHWHKVTSEIFYVLEGNLTLQAGEATIQAGPGGYAFVPPGIVHSFSNQGDTPARYLLLSSPAGLENYFQELAELVKAEPAWPPKDPGKVVALMAKYDTFAPPASA